MKIHQSRWYCFWTLSWGKMLFPKVLTTNETRVATRHRRFPFIWIVSEETIARRRIASIRLSKGLIWSSLIIESAGGSNNLEIRGVGKRKAFFMRETLDKEAETIQGAMATQ